MRALVTGATGFLGGALARRLVALRHDVLATGRDLREGARLREHGVEFAPAELGDRAALARMCAGRDRVFHCAALSSLWGRAQDFHTANVAGTDNVIAACSRAGVGRLIHVSSPSICMDTRDRQLITETEPLPARPINLYAGSKREAEKRVLAAAAAGLPVVVLRPQAVFGPGDPAIFPRILRLAQRGVFPVFGRGDSWIDITCLDNAVDALVLAAEAPERCVGQVYNVSNGDPRPTQELLNRLFAELGLHVRRPRIPFAAAFAAAAVLERLHTWLRLRGEPRLTRYSVCVLARTRTLDIAKARRDLGYVPRVDTDTGLRQFAGWWRENHGNV